MPPNPEEVLELAQKIVAAKSALAGLQAQWDALFSLSQGDPTRAKAERGRRVSSHSPSARILGYLESTPGETYDAQMLTNILSFDSKRIQTALRNLSVSGKIRKLSRGKYRALSRDEPTRDVEPTSALFDSTDERTE